MAALWVVIGLIVATFAVSILGATFSVVGLAALFSGAAMAVVAMASSLEFAKFVLSAYLHQRWRFLNGFYKSYLLFAVVVLSLITSMGIFGFLSEAYQSASSTLEAENIKLEALKTQQGRNNSEISRLNKNIDEIPPERISKRLKARAEAEPLIANLVRDNDRLDREIAQSNLKILEVKQKVGPLIYISRTFHVDIDTVVRYLILLLVLVFDPLAICLVIATSESLLSRRLGKTASDPVHFPSNPMSKDHPSEEILQMRFVDDKDRDSV